MEEWQERVVVEKKELDERIDRLRAFMSSADYAEIPPPDQWLLADQLKVMDEYSRILGERMRRFIH